MLAYGTGCCSAPARDTYLHSLVPWIVLGIGRGRGGFAARWGRAFAGRCSLPRYTVSFAALWLACSACLVAIYASQELLEGLFAAGHPTGWVGVFGYGGWWSIPVAVAVGLVLAAAFHGATWVLHAVAARCGAVARRRRARRPAAPARCRWSRLAALRRGWSAAVRRR